MSTCFVTTITKEAFSEGQVSRGNTIMSTKKAKVFKRNGYIFGFAGCLGHCDETKKQISSIKSIKDVDLSSIETTEPWEFFISDGNKIYCAYSGDKTLEKIDEKYYAIGSGSDFAISAYEFGMSPRECIKYAITKDINSSGKITGVRLDG
jgi:ATP-dependent protease HslVU (ClpYQ) peptidase subunit